MTLAAGIKVGVYEITAPIGAGGMGEVYRARDVKLGREVALKVLPEAFACDADRMARFQREAKVLASLNHPNIAAIYGLEDSGTTHALVMELVEGPTLADRIKQGPVPIDEALRIAKQICEALEYAHERGIVHRDLKPANIKVTNDDAVKVLDFGLAKAIEGDPSSLDISSSPTMSRMATMQGVLLGTAAYMSPEQAKGKSVDRRADIWAFGCVLYEMLTGKMTFTGETVTDTLAAVIRAEPDWSLLPTATPLRIRVLLQRCMQKDPKQRLQAIGDARISIDEILSGAPEPLSAAAQPAATAPAPAPLWRRALPWAAATVLAIVASAFALVYLREGSTHEQSIASSISAPPKVSFAFSPSPYGTPALSPDGARLVCPGRGADGKESLWLRPLDSLDARQLPGTDAATFPFWSPDSQQIGFFQGAELKKIDVTGGPPVTICDAENARGGTWSHTGTIVFAPQPAAAATSTGLGAPLLQVPASGGTPSAIASRKVSGAGFSNRWPVFLPDGRHFLYLSGNVYAPGSSQLGIYIGELGSSEVKFLVYADSDALYAAPGYLLFLRGGTLMAQRFDAGDQELKGGAFPVGENVGSPQAYRLGLFSVSQTGLLVYGSAPGVAGQLVWLDAAGKRSGTAGPPGVSYARLSPDGKLLAYSLADVVKVFSGDIWIEDLARGVQTRFTFGPLGIAPVWSPDGSRIVYASAGKTFLSLFVRNSSGAGDPEPLSTGNERFQAPTDWSRDGRYILFDAVTDKRETIWAAPLFGDRKPFRYLQSQFDVGEGVFSPDGRWIAYVSDESGNEEVYVSSFPDAGSKWQVSQAGGVSPQWTRDGSALYYVAPGGKMMEVGVRENGSAVEMGAPRQLFQDEMLLASAAEDNSGYSVSPDGKRFLVDESDRSNADPLTLVTNWQAEIKPQE
jgi:eukaryotic-like serine/threonine-protein kinase